MLSQSPCVVMSLLKHTIQLVLTFFFYDSKNCFSNPGKGINGTRYGASWAGGWMQGKPCLTRPVCITQWQLKYGLGGKVTRYKVYEVFMFLGLLP